MKVFARDIIDEILKGCDITLADFLSPSRRREVARPRQRSMYLCRELTNLSLPDIGRRHGGRDHTTVLHSIRRVAERMAKDPWEAGEVARLIDKFTPCPVVAVVALVRAETEALVA